MEATSKDDGLVTLILVLLCNLSVRFVREWVTRLLTVFTEILHLLLLSLNVKFVGNVDTLRWSVIIEAIMLIKAVVHLSHFQHDFAHPQSTNSSSQPSFPGPSTSTSPMQAMVAHTIAPYPTGDTWIVDTGVSHHMTSNVNNLNQVTHFEGTDKIKIGNGQGLPIKHVGSAMLHTPSHSLKLTQVLHVPHLTEDLLSVKQLCKDNRCWFICDDSLFFVQDKVTKEVLYQGRSRQNELFQIPVFQVSAFFSTTCSSFSIPWAINQVFYVASTVGASY